MSQNGQRLPELVDIMRKLLAPEGCPWDREQTLGTLRPYVIEEAHEVVDAIDRNDMPNLREELGDLLLQIVFQSALTEQQVEHRFGIDDVIGGICEKLVRRHPHVFGDESAADSAAVRERWEALKAQEKVGRGVLEGVPRAMPALLRAARIGEKAAHIGLDWPDAVGPRRKVDEELAEFDEAVREGDLDGMERELGDAMFALVSLARKCALDPEASLRRSVDTFTSRAEHVERVLRGRGVEARALGEAELEGLWVEAKEAIERART